MLVPLAAGKPIPSDWHRHHSTRPLGHPGHVNPHSRSGVADLECPMLTRAAGVSVVIVRVVVAQD